MPVPVPDRILPTSTGMGTDTDMVPVLSFAAEINPGAVPAYEMALCQVAEVVGIPRVLTAGRVRRKVAVAGRGGGAVEGLPIPVVRVHGTLLCPGVIRGPAGSG